MKACKRILDHLPTKDLSRNKYLIEVPQVTSFIRECIIPLLEESQAIFQKTMSSLKGENIIQEFDFSIENLLMESANVNLLLAEYRCRIKYRYVSNDDIRQFGIAQKKYMLDQDIYKEIEDMEKEDEIKHTS